MLTFLSIRDYVLIDKLDVEFGPGFNVITGETGAGKSIIVESLSLILGERARPDLIRTGTERAVIQGTFEIPPTLRKKVESLGIELEEGAVTVRREIVADGKNRSFINGSHFPLLTLKTLGDLLVDFHGQHEHQSLLREETHLPLLDDFAGLSPETAGYRAAFVALQDKRKALDETLTREKTLKERRDFLDYQNKELERAGLTEGLEQELLSKIRTLEGGRKGLDLAEEIRAALDDEWTGRTAKAEKALRRLADHDPAFGEEAEALENLSRRASAILRRLPGDPGDSGPEDLDGLNARLAELNRLKRKYQRDEAGLIALRDNVARDLAFLTNTTVEKEGLENAIRKLETDARALAGRLSDQRRKAAGKLTPRVNALLAQLNMASARFSAGISVSETLGPDGLDTAAFRLISNPGEPERPLSRIASGGEIARVMLALRSVIAEKDHSPVLVFDEIDTGIGGETAGRAGSLMKELASFHQVFCVTHSPQIAKEADRHYSVDKKVRGNRAQVTLEPLSREARVAELARMLGGEKSKSARDHAAALVKG